MKFSKLKIKIPDLKIRSASSASPAGSASCSSSWPSARPASWEPCSAPIWPSGTTSRRSMSSRTSGPRSSRRSLSDKGEPIKEFAEERRIEVPYASIPDALKNAIIATEDPRFYPPPRRRLRGHPPGAQGRRRPDGPRHAPPAPGREHDHPAAGPLALPLFPADDPAQAQGDVRRTPDREEVLQGEDPRALLQPVLSRPRRLRRRVRLESLFRQERPGPRASRRRPSSPGSSGGRRSIPRTRTPRGPSSAATTFSTGWSRKATSPRPRARRPRPRPMSVLPLRRTSVRVRGLFLRGGPPVPRKELRRRRPLQRRAQGLYDLRSRAPEVRRGLPAGGPPGPGQEAGLAAGQEEPSRGGDGRHPCRSGWRAGRLTPSRPARSRTPSS